jgi:hypothetical protein
MKKMPFKRLAFGLGFIVSLGLVSLSGNSSAQSIDKSLFKKPTGNMFDQRVKRYGKRCSSSSKNATILMLDTTDDLREEQLQFVIDNYAEDFRWNNAGDRFTVIRMGAKPASMMDFISICAPKPEHKIDKVMDPIRKIKVQNKNFKWTFKEIIRRMGSQKKKAKNTLLLESITEVYRSKRYKFLRAKSRKLILVSDLYQHSKIISFLRMCRPASKSAKRIRCPDLATTIQRNSRFANYLQAAKPRFRKSDKVEIYYLNIKGRVDRSAEEWWQGYFTHAGLQNGSLKITPELQ